MKTLNLFGFLSLVVFLIGCQPSSPKKSRINSRGAGAVTAPVTQAPQNSTGVDKGAGEMGAWGEITRANWTQQQFQASVQSFLSNLTTPEGSPISLGTVSGDSNQTTGIRFWGSVGLNGAFQLNGSNNLQVASQGSALRIAIVDSYVGQQNAAGETITEIPIYIAPGVEGFVGVTGSVVGNQAEIHYQDGYGRITIKGQFDSQWFRGQVIFQNNSPAVQGYLGLFTVQTCGFFKCQ